MNKLTGAAVFVVTLCAALLVTSYYKPRPAPPPPFVEDTPPARPAPYVSQPAPRLKVTHKVRLVTLDVAARESHTTLDIELAPGEPAPDRMWVWTGFFVPGDAGGELFAGEPVLVRTPFAPGGRVTVNVTSDCGWCGRYDAPAAGYYARVNVSTVSAADARLGDGQFSRDPSRATQVTVEEGRRRAR